MVVFHSSSKVIIHFNSSMANYAVKTLSWNTIIMGSFHMLYIEAWYLTMNNQSFACTFMRLYILKPHRIPISIDGNNF